MANNTTEDIINRMSREDFLQYAIGGLKDRSICGLCEECRLDCRYFREKFGISDFEGDNCCGSVIGYISKRLEKELATLKPTEPEKEEPENENCSSCKGCKHCKEVGGVLFCEIWHNTTVPEAFCCYHEPI